MKCKIIFDAKTVPTFEDFEKSSYEYDACSLTMIIEKACKHEINPVTKGYLFTDIGHQCYRFEYYKSRQGFNHSFVTQLIGELKPKNLLTFETLRKANIARLPEFKNSKGLPAHSKEDGSDWSPAQWLQAVIGELGEYANVMKKVERGDLTFEEAKPLIEKELADVMTYLDILAFRVGVDLSKAVQEKFNEVSERVGCSLRIENNEVVRKEVKPKTKTYSETYVRNYNLPITPQPIDFAKSKFSETKEELQDELAKIKENIRARIQSGRTKCGTSVLENHEYNSENGEVKSEAQKTADNWIGYNKISNITRAKIEDLIEKDISDIKKSIESESGKVSDVELIANAALLGVKFGEATKLKVDQLIKNDLTKIAREAFFNKSKEDIEKDLKQIRKAGCGTSILENYDYNPKNGELTPKQEFVSKLQTEQEFCNNRYKQFNHELFIKKSFSFDIGGVLNEMVRWKLFRNYAEIYPLKIPRNAIDDIFSFEFQGIDNGKQYLFYHVKQIFHAIQNSSLQIRAVAKSYLFEFFSKQLGTKIVGMLINGHKENKILNPNDTVQFYDDRNVLYNFRLTKSSDKNVEVSNT